MKPIETPTCPRCNSSGGVKKIAYGLLPSDQRCADGKGGYVLSGRCIRPENPDWYCAGCAESFGAGREFWGDPLTDSIQ